MKYKLSLEFPGPYAPICWAEYVDGESPEHAIETFKEKERLTGQRIPLIRDIRPVPEFAWALHVIGENQKVLERELEE